MNILEASLKLFNSVPEDMAIEDYYLEDGILMPKIKDYYLDNQDLKYVVSKVFVKFDSLQNAFYQNWKVIEEKNQKQLVDEAIKHYFSTYSAEKFGIVDFPSYFPEGNTEKIEIGTIIIIGIVSLKDIDKKIKSMLESGIALDNESIKAIFLLKDIYNLNFDIDKVKNKELKAIIFFKMGIIPNDGDELIRVIQYSFTGKTLVIKSKKNIYEWKSQYLKQFNLDDKYINNVLSSDKGIELLASVFFRYKPLILALKIDEESSKIVNKIRKLANKKWKPNPDPKMVFEQIKNNETPNLKNLNIFTLVKIWNKLNSIRNIDLDDEKKFDFYKIRNRKIWIKEIVSGKFLDDKYEFFKSTVLNEIKFRLKNKTILLKDKRLSLAIPTSEKDFIGNIPYGSILDLEGNKIIGIQWQDKENNNTRTDIDLSVVIEDENKVGWDSNYYHLSDNKTKDVMYSGDMTSMKPNGFASEYILNKTNKNLLFMINAYNKEKANYDLIVSDKEDIEIGTLINPNKIVFSTKLKMDSKGEIIGFVKNGLFTFIRLSTSESSTYKFETGNNILKAVKSLSCLQLKDIFNVIYEEDLSEEELKNIEEDESIVDLRNFGKADILNILNDN